jgi:hypothetical protein
VRAWVAAAAILAAVQLVSGCTIVTVGEPVGEVAPLSKELKWQGIWLGNIDKNDLSYVVIVDDADKGVLQICGFGKAKGNKRLSLDLHCAGAQVRVVGRAQVLHIAADEFSGGRPEFRESLKGRWLITLLQHRGEQVILWTFEGNELAKLIEAGKLGGKVIPSNAEGREGQVRIDRLEPELLKRWISENASVIGWSVPLIFDYHPLRD